MREEGAPHAYKQDSLELDEKQQTEEVVVRSFSAQESRGNGGMSGERGDVGGKQEVKISPSLANVPISDNLKKTLTQAYDEPIVANAVAAANQYVDRGATVNLDALMTNACKEAWKPNKTKVDVSQENAVFSKEMLAKCHAFKKTPQKPSDTYLYIGPDYAEIVMVQGAERFQFSDDRFKEKLTERLVYRQLIAG